MGALREGVNATGELPDGRGFDGPSERAEVLRAQRAAYDGLHRAAVEAVERDLTRDEELARLRSLVVDLLGPDADLVLTGAP